MVPPRSSPHMWSKRASRSSRSSSESGGFLEWAAQKGPRQCRLRDTARAMSQENVEELRAFLEAWDMEAWKRGEADLSLLDPEVTYEDTILTDHVGETYRG